MKCGDEMNKEFYSSSNKRWRTKRLKVLRRDRYTCQYFLRYGKTVEANEVHHIYPLELYPQYAYCDWNLISLSKTMHNKMHDRITNKLTKLGKELMRKTKIPLQVPPS